MKFKSAILAGMLAVATSASAQFAQTGNASNSVVDTENYDRITLSFNPQTISPDYDGADSYSMTGISLGYTHGFSISKSHPLFVEVGARLNYSFKSEDGKIYYYCYECEEIESEEGTAKYSYMSLAVPVNIAYKFAVGNVFITPFTGITLKANILSTTSYELDDSDIDLEDVNNFDKDDVGKDGQWKRFQIGWQIGAGVDIKDYYVGLHYGLDFSELAKKVNSSNWAITIGYNF